MFADEKAEWDKFYNFFKKEFNEEVGFMLGVFESDDYEIDLIVGEDSGDIHGVRIMQAIPYEDEEEDVEGDAEIAEIKTREDDEGEVCVYTSFWSPIFAGENNIDGINPMIIYADIVDSINPGSWDVAKTFYGDAVAQLLQD